VAAKGILRAFGDEVRRRRFALEWSQEELADQAGLHRNFVGLIERGQRNITLLTLESLASALGTTMADLIAHAEKARG
jgi:transcriptional regulator with XRE-family HTH domain